MNYLQAPKTERLNSSLLNAFLLFNLLALVLTFTLNFLGLPILKYHYLIHIVIGFLAIVLFDFVEIFPIILTLYFIEGQGRIIWEYASWSRIIFDSLILLSILKIFIKQKKIIDLKKFPGPLIIFIAAHFLWYCMEFSNPNSVSVFAVLAASKVYIYPILLFCALSQIDMDVNGKRFQKNITFLFFLMVMELALSLYQFQMKESLVLQISPYYSKALKGAVFTGKLYRPFSTTQLPGAISVFLFLAVGFLFLKKPTIKDFILRAIFFAVSGWVLILCQVRSAFIKFFLIVVAIHLGELIYYRFKTKGFFAFVGLLIIFAIAPPIKFNENQDSGDESVDNATERISTIGDFNRVKNARLNLGQFSKIVVEKLGEHPLGLGPGLTGPAGSMSAGEIVGNPFINLNTVWASDNLIISLLIDFGIGAIFYLLILFYIPSYFLRFLVIFYRNKHHEPFKILLVCFCTTLVIIFGNWGAIGLTYNPESFTFWFFSAMGFSTIAKFKYQEIAHA